MFSQIIDANQTEMDRRRSITAAVGLYAGMKGVISWLYTGSYSASTAIDLGVAFVCSMYLKYSETEENITIRPFRTHG